MTRRRRPSVSGRDPHPSPFRAQERFLLLLAVGTALLVPVRAASAVRSITVRTEPGGLAFSVDGSTYSSPETFAWEEGSTHTLSVSSPQIIDKYTHTFQSWSDGGGQSHTYTTPAADETVTAVFRVDPPVDFTIKTVPSGLTFRVDGSNYSAPKTFTFVKGSSHTFGVKTVQSAGTGARYKVYEGCYKILFTLCYPVDLGEEYLQETIEVTTDITVTGKFKLQYELTVQSSHGNPEGSGWYNENETAGFSVTSPDGAGDTRRVFHSWSGDHSGTDPSGSIVMNGPKSVTATWETQHWLAAREDPDAGGDMTPSPPGEWYDEGTDATLAASPRSEEGYVFTGWGGDLSGYANPTSIAMDGPKTVEARFEQILHSVRIGTDPEGLEFIVDGTAYSSAKTFSWPTGSSHAIGVSSPQYAGGGARYAYRSWSDGGGQTHPITVSGDAEYTVSFGRQYYLETSVQPDGGGSITPNPPGRWYDRGSEVPVSADPNEEEGYVFAGWAGDLDGDRNPASIAMEEARSVEARFLRMETVRIVSQPPGRTIVVDGEDVVAPREFVWPSGSVHTLEAPPIQEEEEGIRYAFASWSDGGERTHAITVNGTPSYTASFSTQFFLETSAEPVDGGTVLPPPPGAWYDSTEVARVEAAPSPGRVFTGWSGDLEGTESPDSVRMDGPKRVTGNFRADDAAPALESCFPVPGALSVPMNTGILLEVRDDPGGLGVDRASLDVAVNGETILRAGEDRTGGFVAVASRGPGYTMFYRPAACFPERDTVTVNVRAHDLASVENGLDSTYSFCVGTAEKCVTAADTVGGEGGVIVDDSTGIVLTFPPGALQDSTRIALGTVDGLPLLPDSVRAFGLATHFWPDGMVFQEPVSVLVPYHQADLDSAGITDPREFDVFYFSTGEGGWIRLPVVEADETHLRLRIGSFCYLTKGRVILSGVDRPFDSHLPTVPTLYQNHPNPFNPETVIRFDLSMPEHVRLEVFNLVGQRVRTLVDGRRRAAAHRVSWDGRDENGALLNSGVYLIVMTAGGEVRMMKALFVR